MKLNAKLLGVTALPSLLAGAVHAEVTVLG